MKRLLCIVGGMNAGGAETFLMKIYRQIDRNLFQMDFAVGIKDEGDYDKEIYELGGKIFHITPKSKGFLKNFICIKNLVEREQYKYVLRTSQHSLSALELFAARLGGAKVLAFRSSNTNTTTAGGKDLLLHKLCSFMPNLFSNVRIAPSTEAAEYMFGKKCVEKGKAHILHNGVDLSQFCYSKTRREKIRSELGIEKRYVVGHVGRFTAQKNHKFLIDIFSQIVSERKDAVLVLVGEGELEIEIRKQINELHLNDKVLFTGVRKDVSALLSAFDIMIFPSYYEGMPNVIIEAQASGLPCIISNRITYEADITGLVEYVSLDDSAKKWMNIVLQKNTSRIDTKLDFIKKRYDIVSVANEFLILLKMKDGINKVYSVRRKNK